VISAPFDVGAVQVSVIDEFANTGVNTVIFAGAAAGTALFETAGSLAATAVRATTLNVYTVPFVSELITQVVTSVDVQIRPPGLAVTT